jgi:hypothetical protein
MRVFWPSLMSESANAASSMSATVVASGENLENTFYGCRQTKNRFRRRAVTGSQTTRRKAQLQCSKESEDGSFNQRSVMPSNRTTAALRRLRRELDKPMPEVREALLREGVPKDRLATPQGGLQKRLEVDYQRRLQAEEPADNVAQDVVETLRGTCPICLELLPLSGKDHICFPCCCQSVCRECDRKSVATRKDERCPLCRAPPAKNDAEVISRIREHVKRGNSEAQNQLGVNYFDGANGSKRA